MPSEIATTTFTLDKGGFVIGVPFNDEITTLKNSTISYNRATGDGGGIAHTSDTISISNSTISGNSAGGNGSGSHIAGDQGSIMHSTVAFNGADGSGDVFNAGGSMLTVEHTILAENSPGADCGGILTSVGYNLTSDASCGLTATDDLTGADARLGPLQGNGGATSTHALLIGSAALEAGDATYSGPLTTDQRGTGFVRVAGNPD